MSVKEILKAVAVSVLMLLPLYAWGQVSPVYDQASDINTKVSDFGKNVPITATDVQKALKALNDLTITSGVNWGDIGGLQSVINVSGFTNDANWTTLAAVANVGYVTGTPWTTYHSAGTGISISGTGTITNSLPDQTVAFTNGTGISVTGTYPNFTVANTSPDQTVAFTNGTGISVTGTYPNFTVANTAPDQTVTIGSGAGISISGGYPGFTVTNTAPYTGPPTLDTVLGTGSTSTHTVGIGTATITGSAYVSGSLGVGTTLPGAALELWGTGSTSATTGVLVKNSVGTAIHSVLNNGYVGIGTATPADYLSVFNTTNGGITLNANKPSGSVGGIDANTLLALHLDGSDDGTSFVDSSSYGRVATLVGSPVTKTAVKKFGTASGYTSNGADMVTFPDSDDFAFGTNPFTIEAWFYVTNAAKDAILYEQRSDSTHYMVFNYSGASSPKICYLVIYNGSGVYTWIQTDTYTAPTSTWVHLALVRVNSDNAATGWRIFINGVPRTLTLTHGNWNDAVPNYAGTVRTLSCFGETNYAQSYTDELRVSNIARWTADFSASLPSAPYDNSATPVPALTLQDTSVTKWTIGVDPADSDKLKVGTTSITTATALTINSGNIGIGTTTPLNKLDVYGGVTIGTTYAGAQTAPSNGLAVSGSVGIGTYVPGSSLEIMGTGTLSTTSSMNVKNSAGTSLLFVRNDGNIGIGTASPELSLTVRKAGALMVRKIGANTACNTTCGTCGCWFGQNTADFSNVDCADATADVCFCAGN